MKSIIIRTLVAIYCVKFELNLFKNNNWLVSHQIRTSEHWESWNLWHLWHHKTDLLLHSSLESPDNFHDWVLLLQVGGLSCLLDVVVHLLQGELLVGGGEVNLLVEVPDHLANLTHGVSDVSNLVKDLIVGEAVVLEPESIPDVVDLSENWEGVLNNVSGNTLVDLAGLDVVHAPVVSEVHIVVSMAVFDVLEEHIPARVGDFLKVVVANTPDVSLVEESLHGLVVLFHNWVHPFSHASLVIRVDFVLELRSERSIKIGLDGLSEEDVGLVDIFLLKSWAVLVSVLFSVAGGSTGNKEASSEFHIQYKSFN